MKSKIDLIGMALIIGVIYYVFSLSLWNVLSILLGMTFVLVSNKNIFNNKSSGKYYQIWQAITGALLVYALSGRPTGAALFLIGANMTTLYFYLKNNVHLDLAVLNVTTLAGITLLSGVQKFRGYNKLSVTDVNVTIPLIVMTTILIYLLLNVLKASSNNTFKKVQLNVIPIVGFIFAVSYYLISFLFFKEVSIATIFVPLVLGLCAGLLDAFVESKYKRFAQVALLIMLPFTSSGLMGVGLAILSSYLFLFIAQTMLGTEQEKLMDTEIIYPLIFLFGAAELRENAGQITRFNLVSGAVVGWIFLAVLFFSILPDTLHKLKRKLTENELGDYTVAIKMLLATLGLILLIKIGRDQALAAFIVVSIIYLFVSNLVIPRKQLNNNLVLSLTGFVGSIAFFVLTKI